MTTRPHIAMLVGIGLALALPAHAHDFWIERAGGQFTLRSGHAGGTLLSILPERITAIRCLDGAGKQTDVLATAVFERTQVHVNGSCVAISALQNNGYFSLTPDGEKNLPKNKVKDAVKSWRSRQFAKWVDSGSPWHRNPIGAEFEVVPVSELAKAKPGDKATFRILLDGKPVAGAILSIDHKGIGESDDEGNVRIRIREGNTMTVSASFRRPLRSPEADSETFEASLSFEVAK